MKMFVKPCLLLVFSSPQALVWQTRQFRCIVLLYPIHYPQIWLIKMCVVFTTFRRCKPTETEQKKYRFSDNFCRLSLKCLKKYIFAYGNFDTLWGVTELAFFENTISYFRRKKILVHCLLDSPHEKCPTCKHDSSVINQYPIYYLVNTIRKERLLNHGLDKFWK